MVQTTRVKISVNNKVHASIPLKVAKTIAYSNMFYYKNGKTWNYIEFSGREEVPIEEYFALDLTNEEIEKVFCAPTETRRVVLRDLSNCYIGQNTRDAMLELYKHSERDGLEIGFMFYYTETNKELQIKYFDDFEGVCPKRTATSVIISHSEDTIVSKRKNGYIPIGWGHTHGIFSYKAHHGESAWKGEKSQYQKLGRPGSADQRRNVFRNDRNYLTDDELHPSILLSPKGYMIFTNMIWKNGTYLPQIYDEYAKDYSSGKQVFYLDPS